MKVTVSKTFAVRKLCLSDFFGPRFEFEVETFQSMRVYFEYIKVTSTSISQGHRVIYNSESFESTEKNGCPELGGRYGQFWSERVAPPSL